MLKKKPQDRFTAKQCLDHEFFADLPQIDEEDVKIDFTHLKELHNNAQEGFDQDKSSFVQRDNIINGNLNTVKETDSNGGIQSLKGMKDNKKDMVPRTSIYRHALMKDANK